MTDSVENDPRPADAGPGAAVHVSARAAALFLLLVIAAALGCRTLDAEQGGAAALKVVLATLAVGVVPGAMAALVWPPRPRLSAMQVVGFGIPISFVVAQLLVILAVTLHLSAGLSLAILLTAAALMAGRILQRSPVTITISPDDAIVIGLLVALGSCLYLVGAPLDAAEDQIHAGIVRRLNAVESPRLDNVYLTPGVVHTYPFPGTHYFMALVAKLGDIDTLFVYHKLRFFWGTAAIAMLYLIAWAVFRTRGIAGAVTVTAVALVLSGVFSIGFPSGWGQLAPYSHGSDIAMTVLLPALLVVAFWFVVAESKRERTFFLVWTALLVIMLTMVHIREIVQFTAYVGCFAVVTMTVRRFRPYGRRAFALLGLTLVTVAAYTSWQGTVVPLVHDIVNEQRAALSSLVAATSLRELLFAPASTLLVNSIQKFDEIFTGLTPFFLLTGPVVVALFRHRPLVWLVASSTLAYLAVMSVPLLAIPYIYLTYFEMLHIPVRNIHFFVYLFAGAFLYAIVTFLTRFDRTRLSPLVVGTVLGVLGLLTALCLNRSHQGFFLPLIAAYGMTLFFLRAGPLPRRVAAAPVAAMLVAVVGLVSLWPDHQPVPRSEQVTIRWTSGLPDARRVALEQQFSLHDAEPKPDRTDELNAWNYRLSDLSVENVRRIVKHQDVADTHFIDRSTFAVESQPPRGDDLPFGVRYVRWLQYPGNVVLLSVAVLAWGLGFLLPLLVASRKDQWNGSFEAAMSEPFYRRAVPFALFIIPFTVWSVRPTWSPLLTALNHPERHAATPRALIPHLPCLTTPKMQARFTQQLFPEDQIVLPERRNCPPDSAVIEWVQAHLPVNAVFAADRWDPYPPSAFMPQQVVVFPTFEASFIGEDRLFKDYYELFYDRVGRYRVQPFFNAVETPAERAEFVERLGVTHILVNPPHYDEMRPVLDALPGQFALKYSHEKWAVYEATRNTAAGGVH